MSGKNFQDNNVVSHHSLVFIYFMVLRSLLGELVALLAYLEHVEFKIIYDMYSLYA